MDDLKHTSTIDLVNKLGFINKRLKQIEFEKESLETEYNQIIYELWDIIPTLKEDENIQPKVIKKGVKNEHGNRL